MRILLTTVPARLAGPLSRRLVTSKVAACVSSVPGVRSVYRWAGKVEEAGETLLIVKTSVAKLAACSEALAAFHPYEVPEGLILKPSGAFAPYARWVEASTR